MPRRKTHEEFVKEVYDLVGDEYTVLGTYQNSRTNINIKHNKCGHVNLINPNGFLGGNRCYYCSGLKKLTNDEFYNRVYNLVGDEYKPLGEYVNNHTKIKMLHSSCGNEFFTTANRFFSQGQRCPKCAIKLRNKKLTKTQEQFEQEIYEIFGNEYTIIGKYVNDKTKILVRHNKCGNEYFAHCGVLLKGHGCKKCADKENGLRQRKTTAQFDQEVKEKGMGDYLLCSKYNRDGEYVTIKHLVCGNKYKTTPTNFLQGYRCPICNESKMERKIHQYLQDNKYIFSTQYIFDGLNGTHGHPLRFDFAIFNSNNTLKYLIEYDGEYHYFAVYSQDLLKHQQYHDALKDKYCKNMKIPLLRIPYTDKSNFIKIINDFEKELTNKIIKHNE